MFDMPRADTLVSLDSNEQPYSVRGLNAIGSVKRVEDIYDDPEFFVDGATANDVRQVSFWVWNLLLWILTLYPRVPVVIVGSLLP